MLILAPLTALIYSVVSLQGSVAATDPVALLVGCDVGYFGYPGETCLPCPRETVSTDMHQAFYNEQVCRGRCVRWIHFHLCKCLYIPLHRCATLVSTVCNLTNGCLDLTHVYSLNCTGLLRRWWQPPTATRTWTPREMEYTHTRDLS